MAMSTMKLGRLASERVGGEVTRAIHVRWGVSLNSRGVAAALVGLLILGQLLAALIYPRPMTFTYAAAAVAITWFAKRRQIFGEVVMGRLDDEIVLVRAEMSRRNPLRELVRRYPADAAVSFAPSERWWRASAVVIDDDEWFVAGPYTSQAERWFSN